MKDKLFTRNFSLLIAGQTISLFANCILDFAFSMYILEQTGCRGFSYFDAPHNYFIPFGWSAG